MIHGDSGSFLIISSTTGCIIALTWGGIVFSWSSDHILIPLVLGICGMVIFLVYEARYAYDPIVSVNILIN